MELVQTTNDCVVWRAKITNTCDKHGTQTKKKTHTMW